MRINLSKKSLVVILILMLALLAVVATVSAADASGFGAEIAALDLEGAEGVTNFPISGTDHRLISPWVIEATRIRI